MQQILNLEKKNNLYKKIQMGYNAEYYCDEKIKLISGIKNCSWKVLGVENRLERQKNEG